MSKHRLGDEEAGQKPDSARNGDVLRRVNDTDELRAAYQQMAGDEAREISAHDWSEALFLDISEAFSEAAPMPQPRK